MNVFDEWHSIVASGLAADHKAETLSSAAVSVTLSTAGWWKVSADVDIWLRGPSAAASTVTASTGQHEWAKDTAIFNAKAGEKIAALRVGAVAGTLYVDRIKGE